MESALGVHILRIYLLSTERSYGENLTATVNPALRVELLVFQVVLSPCAQ